MKGSIDLRTIFLRVCIVNIYNLFLWEALPFRLPPPTTPLNFECLVYGGVQVECSFYLLCYMWWNLRWNTFSRLQISVKFCRSFWWFLHEQESLFFLVMMLFVCFNWNQILINYKNASWGRSLFLSWWSS